MATAMHGFSVTHEDDAIFVTPVGQPYFRIRDLGVAAATSGAMHAQIVRAADLAGFSGQSRHRHDVSFHFVYLIRGWLKCQFQDHGEVIMRAGSSWLQPGGEWHAMVSASDDFEAIELISPAGAGVEFLDRQ